MPTTLTLENPHMNDLQHRCYVSILLPLFWLLSSIVIPTNPAFPCDKPNHMPSVWHQHNSEIKNHTPNSPICPSLIEITVIQGWRRSCHMWYNLGETIKVRWRRWMAGSELDHVLWDLFLPKVPHHMISVPSRHVIWRNWQIRTDLSCLCILFYVDNKISEETKRCPFVGQSHLLWQYLLMFCPLHKAVCFNKGAVC